MPPVRISRKSAYKWIERYRREGAAGLRERTSRPLRSPGATSEPIVAAIVKLREEHPSWGAKKLLKVLSRRNPDVTWPARTTVCDILTRRGLVLQRRRRRVMSHPGRPAEAIEAPNQIWCADFKGQFKTRDGRYCYPLTVTDAYSRYLLECKALPNVSVEQARPYLMVSSESTACRSVSAPTMDPLLPVPARWPDSRSSRPGGCA
jgi:putative transposase